MTAMMPAHFDPANGGLSHAMYDHTGAGAMGHGHPGGAHGGAHPATMQPKPKLFFKMPRVVHDQKSKFENDELFRRLARESEVRYTGYRDRPMEERKLQFQKGVRAGLIEIAIVSNGTNINLTFPGTGNNFNNNNNNTTNDKEVDILKEPGKVHIRSPFILNGVCVRWKGWLDSDRLDGMGSLEYDEENAQEEERIFREELERHRIKLREMDEKHRSTFRQPSSTSSAVGTTISTASATAAAAAALHHHHTHSVHHGHGHIYHGHSGASEQANIQVR